MRNAMVTAAASCNFLLRSMQEPSAGKLINLDCFVAAVAVASVIQWPLHSFARWHWSAPFPLCGPSSGITPKSVSIIDSEIVLRPMGFNFRGQWSNWGCANSGNCQRWPRATKLWDTLKTETEIDSRSGGSSSTKYWRIQCMDQMPCSENRNQKDQQHTLRLVTFLYFKTS